MCTLIHAEIGKTIDDRHERYIIHSFRIRLELGLKNTTEKLANAANNVESKNTQKTHKHTHICELIAQRVRIAETAAGMRRDAIRSKKKRVFVAVPAIVVVRAPYDS